ncbi:ATP-binding cassette domain-containing protein [Bacillus benzoevorans]|uniref:ABC-type multidrug transport system ATPase subunit n=1 Tax=Bacillus benzoevorans TaxID=1456 RepID=A0A7X0HV03_9BACI|nr:ABC-type multidrug transport system ATPase subunit [Bacillus benzoevorans]
MSLLEVKDISKIYKSKTALSPLSLEAAEGECLVLAGGNGAGKSTLLYLLSGILSPSSGRIMLNHIDLHKNRKQYVKEIGYMPDDFQAEQTLSVEEFLSFYASLRHVGKDRVRAVIDRIGLEEQARTRISKLSKGMRQRLIFGQAILSKPALLLLDEPTNGLDPYWVNVFVKLIKEIQKDGTIVIFSTHMMDVAADAADRIFFMKDGQVIDELSGEEQKDKLTMKLLKLHRQS